MDKGKLENKGKTEKEPTKLRKLVRKAKEKVADFLNGFPKKDPLLEIRPPF
jgi:uncharacterized protein YjbJ (UPF0337 family)